MNNFFTISVLGVLLLASTAGAAEDSTKTPSWYQNVELHSFLSSGYSYNMNDPDNQKNQFHVFDFDDNTMKIDVLELVLMKEPVANEAGFHVDLTAGSSIPQVARSAGFNVGDLDFHQIFVSFIVPIGGGLRIDAGKFVTPMGYEVIEGYDGFNENYSRSFLFGYAIPFTHTGVKGSYAVSQALSVALVVCNGWDVSIDNNRSKTVGMQVGLSLCNGLTLGLNGMAGPEKPGHNADYRKIIDIAGSYPVGKNVRVGLNGDYGMEEHSSIGGGTALWRGIAGYGRWTLCNNVALNLRLELFNDVDGVRTGGVQKLGGITFTPEYRFSSSMMLRGDFRVDQSNDNVFFKAGELTKSQTTMSLNLIYSR